MYVGKDPKSHSESHELDDAVSPSPQNVCGEDSLKMFRLKVHHLNDRVRKSYNH